MTADVRIERFRSVYRVPAGAAEPEALRARLDGVARAVLGEALERALARVLATLGLGSEAEIAVDRVAVRLRVRGSASEDASIADAWASAIAEDLGRSLEPLVQRGGGASEGVALFASRFEAERAYLEERFLGGTEAWWWRPILGREGGAPSPRDVIARWIQAVPERVPSEIAALALASPEGVSAALGDAEAAALADELEAARRDRQRVIARSLPPTRARREPLPADPPEAAAPHGAVGGDAAILLEALRRVLDPAEIAALTRTRRPGVRRLLATCLLLARRPSAGSLAGWLAESSAQRSAEREGARIDDEAEAARVGDDAAEATASRTPEAIEAPAARADAPPQPRPAERDADPRPRSAPREPVSTATSPREAAAREHRIGCGGLLFLVRRVAASSLLDDHRGAALEERLVALGWIALHRALDRLPEGARRAALERDRPLLDVFAGTSNLPDDLHATPNGRAAADAVAVLDAIAAELPADLEAFRDGVIATYGPEAAPFEPRHPHRALAHLLLRPGQVHLTRTDARLHLPARAIDVALRVGGWDIDPGFVPHLGRVIRFHYEAR